MLLLTGASGLLGGAVIEAARGRNIELVAVTHSFPIAATNGVIPVACDLTRGDEVRSVFERFRPALVINAAAITNVDWCETNEAMTAALHVDAAGRVAAESQRISAKMIQVSTDSVFDGRRGSYIEQDETGPLNVYARTKLDGERAVLAAAPDALVVRTNIYGWNVQPKQSLGEWIVARLESGAEVRGFRDVITSPILTNDLADALLDLGNSSTSGVLHLGGGEACSKYEFARRVAVVFGLDSSRVVSGSVRDVQFVAPRPLNTSLDSSRARARLGRSLPDVDAGLRRFKALRDNGFVERLHALRGALSHR